MKFAKTFAAALLTAAALSALTPGAVKADQRRPVIVELFTSEGCSDCPPADQLLSSLTRDQPVTGAYIIPLEEHINYWDNPKHWVDPFSLAAVTQRQYDYAAKFNDDSPYTPEMVVDGTAHFVGSDRGAAVSAVESAMALPIADLRLSIDSSSAAQADFTITVKNIPRNVTATKLAVFLAVTEDGLVSHVVDGENRGRTLPHSAVTRSIGIVGTIAPSGANMFNRTLTIPASWKTHPLHAVAFLQDISSKRIYGSDEISL